MPLRIGNTGAATTYPAAAQRSSSGRVEVGGDGVAVREQHERIRTVVASGVASAVGAPPVAPSAGYQTSVGSVRVGAPPKDPFGDVERDVSTKVHRAGADRVGAADVGGVRRRGRRRRRRGGRRRSRCSRCGRGGGRRGGRRRDGGAATRAPSSSPPKPRDPGRDHAPTSTTTTGTDGHRHPAAAPLGGCAASNRGDVMREHGSAGARCGPCYLGAQLSSMLMACFGHCRTACVALLAQVVGRVLLEHVEEVVVADFEHFGDDRPCRWRCSRRGRSRPRPSRPLCLLGSVR